MKPLKIENVKYAKNTGKMVENAQKQKVYRLHTWLNVCLIDRD